MMTILAGVWGFLISVPFAVFPIVYLIVFRLYRDRRRATNWSVNITNIFFIKGVAVSYSVVWPDALPAWWWMIILFAALVVWFGWLQIRRRGKISVSRIGISAWRFSFVIFGFVYLFLFGSGIWKNMQTGYLGGPIHTI